MKEGNAIMIEAVGVKLGIIGNSVVQGGKWVANGKQKILRLLLHGKYKLLRDN